MSRENIRAIVENAKDERAEPPRPLMRELPPADPFPVEALGTVLAPAAQAIHRRRGRGTRRHRDRETHVIDIDRFVPHQQIDQRFFGTPYYVVPSEPVGHEAFAVIREEGPGGARSVGARQTRAGHGT